MAYKVPAINTMSRLEFIADIPWTDNTILQLPQGGLIPNDRFLFGLLLQFEGRFTQPATGNATGVQADGPISIIDSVSVQGMHRIRGQNEQFINARAADLYEEVLEKTGRAPLNTGTLEIAANATSDIRFVVPIIFPPIGISPAQQIGYLLDTPNYDRPVLSIKAADLKSVFTGQSGVIAESAYGSSTGTPRIRVSGIFAQAGASQFAGFVPARVFRYNLDVNPSLMTTGGTQLQLHNVSVGNYIRSLLIKTGVKSTTVSAGNTAFNSLSDNIVSNLKLSRGLNKQIYFASDFNAAREATAEAYRIAASQGFSLIDFCPRGSLATLFNTVSLVAGPTGDTAVQLLGDVVGAANQGMTVLYEELKGLPMQQ